jgi:hypothetical protein
VCRRGYRRGRATAQPAAMSVRPAPSAIEEAPVTAWPTPHTTARLVAIALSLSTPKVGSAHRFAHLAPDQPEVTTDGIAR